MLYFHLAAFLKNHRVKTKVRRDQPAQRKPSMSQEKSIQLHFVSVCIFLFLYLLIVSGIFHLPPLPPISIPPLLVNPLSFNYYYYFNFNYAFQRNCAECACIYRDSPTFLIFKGKNSQFVLEWSLVQRFFFFFKYE